MNRMGVLWRVVAGVVLSGWMASAAWAQSVQVRVQDSAGQPLEGAVVFLDSAEAVRRVRPVVGAEVVQQNKAFAPSVLVVTRGTAVQFPNKDTLRHHVYSFSPTKKFELKLYVGTPANPVQFDQAGVVVLGCNIHDHMVGWILVVDTPYYAQTRADGWVTLEGVPRGDHVLRVWHHRLPVGNEAQAQRIKLADGAFSATVILKDARP